MASLMRADIDIKTGNTIVVRVSPYANGETVYDALTNIGDEPSDVGMTGELSSLYTTGRTRYSQRAVTYSWSGANSFDGSATLRPRAVHHHSIYLPASPGANAFPNTTDP